MHCVRKVTDDLYWIGANDNRTELFENIHPIPEGVSYNSYLLLDEKTVLFDSVDWTVCRQFLENLAYVLKDRPLDYMVINHMEPDHAASIAEVLIRHPETTVISNEKAFLFMRQFGFDIDGRMDVVKEGDTTGIHNIKESKTSTAYDLQGRRIQNIDAFHGIYIMHGKKVFTN